MSDGEMRHGYEEEVMKSVKLTIDGKAVEVPDGTTILDAARANGINIPTLCHLEGVKDYGGCRLCLVEIKGSSKVFPACTTPVAPGMEVTTNSERLREYRKMTVQLLLSERAHICSVCVANGACELQSLASELGVDQLIFERDWPELSVDLTHAYLVIDRNRCILCTRCIRVCDEIEGVHTLDLMLRGKETQVVIDLNENWKNAPSCTGCRKCAKVCPVGAIYVKGEALSSTKDKEVAKFITERRRSAFE